MCVTGDKEQPPLNERKKNKQKDFKKMNIQKLETWKFILNLRVELEGDQNVRRIQAH